MRKWLPAILLGASALLTSARGQEPQATNNAPAELKKIGADEARKHYGENLVVTGKVAQVTIREKVVFLNLDQPYPNSPFTCVIFSSATNDFGDLSRFKNKAIEVTGTIKDYNDKPEIVLSKKGQIKVVESP